MKKRILIPFVMSLLFCLPFYAGAEEVIDTSGLSNNDVKVVKAFRATNNVLEEISIEEFNKIEGEAKQFNALDLAKIDLLKSAQFYENNSIILPMDATYTTVYKYNESGYIYNVPLPLLNKRISVPVYNESKTKTAKRTITFSASRSYSTSYSINVNGKIKAITAGITGGSSWTNTYSGSDSVAQDIPPLNYSWMDYYPIVNNSYGYMNEKVYVNTQSGTVLASEKNTFTDIFIPRKMDSGLPDGLYVVKESLKAPTY
ncbi:hypothetical protein EC604_01520 [Paenibacillus amylolyticus]|uniref:Uncharacterized protein n=1 Tax=Paenibacillus amylolyticus TaxID=1451 RepID=A0A5M9WLT2_PAEAM|nr:hypothetical protein [Paenibacillus amylolyticus]KAA8782527.1 hypothetical protein EC604_01520 [Paenibacillus amylolyticus]